MPAVILAGGLATRLRPLTADTPKALIELAGILFSGINSNFSRAMACVMSCWRSAIWEKDSRTIRDGSELGIHIGLCIRRPKLLGTAGAIRQALPLLPQSFFVLYGDSYLPCDYRAVQYASGMVASPA